MPRTQRLQLSDAMLRRLNQCPHDFKESGEADDPTRLISSWLGANDVEKKHLEDIVSGVLPLVGNGSITATRVKESYPMFCVFTTKVLGQEITNAKRRHERVANGKYLLSSWPLNLSCCFFLKVSSF